MAYKLQNYLRTFRKRTGLSQDEMAFLLGCNSGAKVSRYERFTNQPHLKATLAYELVFGVSARQLFAGLVQDVEQDLKCRARLLVQKLGTADQDRKMARKLTILRTLASEPGSEPSKHR